MSNSDADRADILAFAPHPDDIELCCGGTLIQLADRGYRVGLVDLTRGDRGTRGTPEERLKEAEAARVLLGAAFRTNLGFPDTGLDSRDPAQLLPVVETIRRHRPHLVFVSSEHDHHPDHVEAAHLVERAAYVSGLLNYAAAGEAHRPARILFYMGRIAFEPRLIIDVTPVWERKLAAARSFRSQFYREPGDPKVTRISDPDFFEAITGRFRHFGGRIGVPFAEPFDLREPFGLTDVGALLDGRRPGGSP